MSRNWILLAQTLPIDFSQVKIDTWSKQDSHKLLVWKQHQCHRLLFCKLPVISCLWVLKRNIECMQSGAFSQSEHLCKFNPLWHSMWHTFKVSIKIIAYQTRIWNELFASKLSCMYINTLSFFVFNCYFPTFFFKLNICSISSCLQD